MWFQAYRHELLEAYECCMKFKRTGKDAELTQVSKSWCLRTSAVHYFMYVTFFFLSLFLTKMTMMVLKPFRIIEVKTITIFSVGVLFISVTSRNKTKRTPPHATCLKNPYSKSMLVSLLAQPFQSTQSMLVDLNHIERNSLKCYAV